MFFNPSSEMAGDFFWNILLQHFSNNQCRLFINYFCNKEKMMSAQDCFSRIIGLSRSECSCFEEGRPEDYNLSDSDLYLSELEFLNLNMAEAASDCSASSLWQIMMSAREEAVNHFQSDLMGCIRSKTKLQRKGFKGLIGNPDKENADISLNSVYHGQQWYMANVSGGYIKVKRIGTVFNQTGTITLKLYDNKTDDVLAEIILNTTAFKTNWNTITPIELPLKADGNNLRYSWLYEPTPGLKARNIKIDCNCGSGFHPSWNVANPQFNSLVNKGGFGWADWQLAAGIKINDLASRDTVPNTTNETQGLVFEVEIGCKMDTVLCDEEFNFIDNPFAKVMAHAIRYRAAAIVLNKGIVSGNPSRYTLLDGDNVVYAIKQCMKEYSNRIDWLCEEISKPENINQNSDCLVCNDEYGFMKSGIFK